MLKCDADCILNDSDCAQTCGNGIVEGREACDGDEFTPGLPRSCVEHNPDRYVGGLLACGSDCSLHDFSCTLPLCGDGKIEGEEECEEVSGQFHPRYRDKTCADFRSNYSDLLTYQTVPFTRGEYGCRRCRIETTACFPPPGCYRISGGGLNTWPTVGCI
jgi:hypothetical protein